MSPQSGLHKFIVLTAVLLMAACSGESESDPGGEPASSASIRPVTGDRIVNANAEPQNWLSHGRTYDEQRFSPLYDINESNVAALELAWYFDIATNRSMEATPLVADGVMYVTAAWSVVYALNTGTGELLWNDKVYVATIDGYLVALDARNGKVVWKTDTIDRTPPFTITGAP